VREPSTHTPITVQGAFDWAETLRKLVSPIVVGLVLATAGIVVIRGDLTTVIDTTAKHQIYIEKLQLSDQRHELSVAELQINHRAILREMEQKFQSLTDQLKQVNEALAELLRAERNRK